MLKRFVVSLLLIGGVFYPLRIRESSPGAPSRRLKILVDMKKGLNAFLTQNSVKKFIDDTQFTAQKTPNIFFFFIDTLRADRVTSDTAPNLYQFSKDNVSFPLMLAGASNTHHASFSLFNARPAYEFVAMARDNYTFGAWPLHIFKKLGYSFNVFSEDIMFPCLNRKVTDEFGYWDQLIQVVFSEKSQLIRGCYDSAYKETWTKGTKAPSGELISQDAIGNRVNMDRLLNRIQNKNVYGDEKNFFLFFSYSIHDPYSYDPVALQEHEIEKPSKNMCWGYSDTQKVIQNSYLNAVKSLDKEMKRFFDLMKTPEWIETYKKSIVIIAGDHGERLDKEFLETECCHGGVMTKEILYPYFSIKLPDDENEKIKAEGLPKIASIGNVMPTLFTSLGVNERGEQFSFYEPLQNLKETSSLSISPNQNNHTRHGIFHNETYKIYIEFNFDINSQGNINAEKSTSFYIRDIKDLNENSLLDQEPFKSMSDEEIMDKIKIDFRDVLNKTFNS